MATSAELLEETNAAISACLSSQQYTIRGRMQQRARLQELQAFRRELLTEIAESSVNSGYMASVGKVDRPT